MGLNEGLNERIYSCECGWYREIAAYAETEKIDHPIYGKVTVLHAAKADIRAHDCEAYLRAIARLILINKGWLKPWRRKLKTLDQPLIPGELTA